MSAAISTEAAGVAALIVSAHTMALLVKKGVISLAEAKGIVKQTATEIGQEDPAFRAQARHALASVFPDIAF